MAKNLIKALSAAAFFAGPAHAQAPDAAPQQHQVVNVDIYGDLQCAKKALVSAKWAIHLSGDVPDTYIAAMTVWNGSQFATKLFIDKDSSITEDDSLIDHVKSMLGKAIINAFGECERRSRLGIQSSPTFTL